MGKIVGVRTFGRRQLVAATAVISFGYLVPASAAMGQDRPVDSDVAAAPRALPPIISDLLPGDAVTNRLARQSPAPRPRPRERSFGRFLESLFGSKPKVIGPAVQASSYPWQVALRVNANGKAWRCGGILIAPHYVLTAAHCLDAIDAADRSNIERVNASSVEVFHGSSEYARGSIHPADPNWGSRIHPDWKTVPAAPFLADAALIRLIQPIHGSSAPIQVASTTAPKAIVSGWGRFDRSNEPSPVLRAVVVPLIDNILCFNHLPADRRNLVSTTSLCAESPQVDACKGDSGGPLVIGSRQRPQAIGIVSWGPSENCGLAGANGTLVGGYTRASAIAAWVREVTGDPATQTSEAPGPLFDVIPIAVGGGIDR